MKPLSAELRRKIETLRKTLGNNAEPNWQLDIYRDREKMLGLLDGERITEGPDADVQPAVAQSSDGRYHVVFERGGELRYKVSGTGNVPRVDFTDSTPLFPGRAPDVDFYGSFSTTGAFTSSDLLLVYEEPAGTMLFRRRDEGTGTWGAAVQAGAGENPTIVRAWANPPEVGTQDEGLCVFYTRAGQLCYRESTDVGATWTTETVVDLPAGGTKRNPQVFRLADYTLAVLYEYDNGISSDVYMLKTQRQFYNIASPDETVRAGAGGFRHFEWVVVEIGAPTVPDETVITGVRAFRQFEWTLVDQAAPDETVTAGAGGFRQAEFTGVSP
jgi:hypothetical protein